MLHPVGIGYATTGIAQRHEVPDAFWYSRIRSRRGVDALAARLALVPGASAQLYR